MERRIVFLLHMAKDDDDGLALLKDMRAHVLEHEDVRQRHHIELHIYDDNRDMGPHIWTGKSKMLMKTVRARPDIVVLSCRKKTLPIVAETVHDIKTLVPECTIIIAGSCVSEEVLEYCMYADIGIQKDYAKTLSRILEDTSLDKISHIIYKDKEIFRATSKTQGHIPDVVTIDSASHTKSILSAVPQDTFFEHARIFHDTISSAPRDIPLKVELASFSDEDIDEHARRRYGIKCLGAPHFTCIKTCSQDLKQILKTHIWSLKTVKAQRLIRRF